MLLYMDSSAFVKLLVRETASIALQAYLRGTTVLTSVVTPIEVERLVRRRGLQSALGVSELFLGVELRELDEDVAVRASALKPLSLRALDAIQLASAVDLRTELDAFITYDMRLAEAARAHRLPVVTPA